MENGIPFVKSPAFQIYPADFLADANTLVMSAAEVGAYWLLLCVCWRENGLPDDIAELADLARTPVKQFQVSWEKRIQRCFMKRDDGMWTHNRLEKERVKQAVNRKKRQEAGAKGADLRWQKDSNAIAMPLPDTDTTKNGDGKRIAKDSLSSSSSISSSKKKDPDEASDGDPLAQVTDLIEFRGGSREGAGSFLGKCLKHFPREEVEKVAALAVVNNAQDPKAYMRSILENTARKFVSQAEMNSARTAAETGRPVI